jgi:hypothetical protein
MFETFPIVQERQAQGFSALSSFIKGVGCVKMSLGHALERAWIFSAESGSGGDAPPPQKGDISLMSGGVSHCVFFCRII